MPTTEIEVNPRGSLHSESESVRRAAAALERRGLIERRRGSLGLERAWTRSWNRQVTLPLVSELATNLGCTPAAVLAMMGIERRAGAASWLRLTPKGTKLAAELAARGKDASGGLTGG